MACQFSSPAVPYQSYSEYISKLAEIDEGYADLQYFFIHGNIRRPPSFKINKHPYSAKFWMNSNYGGVTVVDIRPDGLKIETYTSKTPQEGVNQYRANRRPPDSKARIVFISYRLDGLACEISELDVPLLEEIALEYQLHPEILRLHFGSTGDLKSYPYTKAGSFSTSPYVSYHSFQLHYGSAFLSSILHPKCSCSKSNTMVILALNKRGDLASVKDSATSLRFLDTPFPDVESPQAETPIWTNDIYIGRLKQMISEQIKATSENLVEFLVPYGHISATEANHRLTLWKSMEQTNELDKDLSSRYVGQSHSVIKMKRNFQEFKRFAPANPSQQYTVLLGILKMVMTDGEEQLESLRLMMNYRASLASLAESRAGVKYAEQGLQQNNRVKRLTQLAFAFIPLSAVTSIFGMNLDVLDSGSAKVWMVIVATAISYTLILLFWCYLSDHIRTIFA